MKYLFFLPLFFASNLVKGQTVTIDNVSVPVEYYRIPDEPLDASFKTYSAEVSMRSGELFRTGLSEGSLESEFIILSGYQKVFASGDVHIEATIGEFRTYSERTGTHQTKSKDKDGKETVRVQYYVELRYSQPIAYRVTDRRGRTLEDEYVYHSSDDQTWKSSYYSSRSDLDRFWRSNRNYKLGELQKERIRQGLKLVYQRINDRYGYQLISENERIEKIGRKKHPLYSGYNTAAETVKKAFKLMEAEKSLNDVAGQVQHAIDFYKTADATCRSGNKDDLKLKHIGLYNLALIYFWLEDFENARLYAESIYKFDAKDKDAKRLLEQIDYVQSSLSRANLTSRHQIVVGKKE